MLYFWLGLAALVGLGTLTMVDAAPKDSDDHPVVVMETSLGPNPIEIELDRVKAPITVDNFLKYVDAGFYDGLTFHRVIPGFVIQGGGHDDQMREKTQGQRGPIKNEARNGLSNKRGTICMARTTDPDSATSQFFINLSDDNAPKLDPRPGSAGYAVFGKVIAGMDTVDAIAKVPTTRKGFHEDVPAKPVYIKSVKRKAKA
jgi:peptidyl-prolyl cis-trans isomerase A (cyclophilin A)